VNKAKERGLENVRISWQEKKTIPNPNNFSPQPAKSLQKHDPINNHPETKCTENTRK
jgi:hypothetical protein